MTTQGETHAWKRAVNRPARLSNQYLTPYDVNNFLLDNCEFLRERLRQNTQDDNMINQSCSASQLTFEFPPHHTDCHHRPCYRIAVVAQVDLARHASSDRILLPPPSLITRGIQQVVHGFANLRGVFSRSRAHSHKSPCGLRCCAGFEPHIGLLLITLA